MRSVATTLTVVLGLLLAAGPASADDGQVEPGDDDFNVVIQHVEIGSVGAGGDSYEAAQGVQPDGDAIDPCDVYEICSSDLVCEPETASPLGGILVYYDGGPGLSLGWCDVTEGQVALSPGVVLAAFRNLPLPASTLVVQPPGGRTLVNFATNFYTESGPFTRSVNLLGQQVDLRIWPSSFGWRFGDGGQVSTSSAGAPYPDLLITHGYRQAGDVSPSVDTTYAAQFSVNGGPWRDVSGTVTIPGDAVALEVITASPVLVGYR